MSSENAVSKMISNSRKNGKALVTPKQSGDIILPSVEWMNVPGKCGCS